MSLNLSNLLIDSGRLHAERTALVLGDDSLTYAQLLDRVEHFAGALRALGLERGDKVALMLPNVPEFTVAYFGALFVGCPVVPLNVLLTPAEVAYHLEDSDAVALVAWSGFAQSASAGFERVAGCRELIVAGPAADASEGHAMEALTTAASPVVDPVATSPDDTAVVLYTSGTTGRPKGAELSHFNLFYNADYVRSTLLPMPAEDAVALATLPLFHSFGQTVIQNRFLMGGGKVVLLPRFSASAALEAMARHGVTFFAGVPTMYVAMLAHESAEPHDLSRFSCCVSGGAAMPVDVLNAFEQRYGVPILEGYGLSETSPVACFNSLDRPRKPGSIGTPIGGVRFRLLADDGSVVEEPGVPGEICIKGHNVMKGYYNKPEATAEVLQDGWFRTGDVGTRDGDGYYTIVDRKKDMIIRGGFNVYPREIEEVLYAHPAVEEVAVIGLPHPSHGEEVCAVVVLRKGESVSESEIRAHCRTELAAYKYPRVVRIVASLPKGPTGKILKREIRVLQGGETAAVAAPAHA